MVGKAGPVCMVGAELQVEKSRERRTGQEREDQGRGLTEGLPDTGRGPGKPRLCSQLGGGLMPLVTGSPAGLGGRPHSRVRDDSPSAFLQ